jgi:hypothetical protein
MDQNTVVNKVLKGLLDGQQQGLIDYKDLRGYLRQVYAAGYDDGRLQRALRKPVFQYTMEGEFIERHDSATLAAKKMGVTKSSICKAASGATKHSGNFIWRYQDVKNTNSSRGPEASL